MKNSPINRRALEVFDAICDLPGSERAAALEQHCGDDAELRDLVQRMLQKDAGDDASRLDRGASQLLEAAPPTPERIGRYHIVREIGHGGMGVVYEAEQRDPQRRVALKVIRSGVVSPEIRARFRQESELLARLDHPGIAHVYEAGEEQFGNESLPFFAMEFISGEVLDAHVRSVSLSTAETLVLFERVCDAVRHAHQKGVIHRDLKPANILVKSEQSSDRTGSSATAIDRIGQPKILDFGVARLTDRDHEARTLQTVAGQLVGTLAYMSPEQLEGRPEIVDTRSDVYAIGVMLYEVLGGRLPVDIRHRPFAEAARLLRDTEAKRLGALDPALRGDIETIVATAMAREPDRRYPSAAELAEDLRRFRDREPLAARPPSALYQLAKFAARNRALVGGVAASLVLLIVGVIGTSIGLVSALRANEQLTAQNKQLEALSGFQESQLQGLDVERMGVVLRRHILEAVPAEQRPHLDSELRHVNFTTATASTLEAGLFQRSLASIERDFNDQPKVQARLYHALGGTLRDLGLSSAATDAAGRAAELWARELGADHAEALQSQLLLSTAKQHDGNPADVLATQSDLVARATDALGELSLITLNAQIALANTLIESSQAAAAAEILEPLRQRSVEHHGKDHAISTALQSALAAAQTALGDQRKAADLTRELLESARRTLGDDSNGTVLRMVNLAAIYLELGQLSDAEPLAREALEIRRRRLGDEHPLTLHAMRTLLNVLNEGSNLEEAIRIGREALKTSRHVLGSDHIDTLRAMNSLAGAIDRLGRYEAAEALYRESYERHTRVFGSGHPQTLIAASNLGYVLRAQNDIEAAMPYYRACYEGLLEIHGEEHPSTLASMGNLAGLLAAHGRMDDAERLHRRCLATRERVLGADHPSTLLSVYNVGDLLVSAGKLEAAEPFCIRAIDGYRALGERHRGFLHSLGLVGTLRLRQGRLDEAEQLYRAALERCTAVLGAKHPMAEAAQGRLDSVLAQKRGG